MVALGIEPKPNFINFDILQNNKMNNGDVVKTRTGVMKWDQESHILFVDVYEGARETLEDAMSNSKLGAEITQNSHFGMLLDITGIGHMDADARRKYLGRVRSGQVLEISAFISKTYDRRMMGAT